MLLKINIEPFRISIYNQYVSQLNVEIGFDCIFWFGFYGI